MFVGHGSHDKKQGRPMWLPCGKCIGCRLVRARSWAIRCVHEASMHKENCFVTLTYDDDHYSPSLEYRDFQKFMYRIRTRLGKTRFFMCGEYGEQTLRPHFHALLFGRTFGDGVPCGESIYSSPTLTALWPYGFSSFGQVTRESAAYVARYSVGKVTGDMADTHYTRIDLRTGEFVRVCPEFGHMSLKPGIGARWFERYWREVYVPRDGVVRPGGFVAPPPRYYDKLLERIAPVLLDEKKARREFDSLAAFADNTRARLIDREECARAKMRFLRRGL